MSLVEGVSPFLVLCDGAGTGAQKLEEGQAPNILSGAKLNSRGTEYPQVCTMLRNKTNDSIHSSESERLNTQGKQRRIARAPKSGKTQHTGTRYSSTAHTVKKKQMTSEEVLAGYQPCSQPVLKVGGPQEGAVPQASGATLAPQVSGANIYK